MKSPVTEVDKEGENESGSRHVYEIPIVQPHNEQSTYTTLKPPEEREDDHVYGHLNQVPHIHANREESATSLSVCNFVHNLHYSLNTLFHVSKQVYRQLLLNYIYV